MPGAIEGLVARLTKIECQSAIAEIGAMEMVSRANHHVPGAVERVESHAKEVESLHSMVRACLHAAQKLLVTANDARDRRSTDRVLPHSDTVVLGGVRRATDAQPLTLRFASQQVESQEAARAARETSDAP